jgi:hypothetical protein
MGDQAYQRKASKQRKRIILSIIALVVIGCAAFTVSNTFYDRCTRSFNRQPEVVLSSYLDAVSQGDLDRVENCWERNAYFDLNSGCSEICISRLMGTKYQVTGAAVGQPTAGENGRSSLKASAKAVCQNGETVTGEAVLDAVAGQIPWKHWRIIRSSIGGSSAALWCQ